MKPLLRLVVFLLLAVQGYAQPGKAPVLLKSAKAAFDSCKRMSYLVKELPQKEPGKLVIPVKSKAPKVLVNDGDLEEYHYIGSIKKTDFVLVQQEYPNEEAFFLVNQSTGTMDTLIGPPVFASDQYRFVCINNPGTDKPQMIQMGEIKNGTVRKSHPATFRQFIIFSDIRFYNKDLLVIKDWKNKYWKIKFNAFRN